MKKKILSIAFGLVLMAVTTISYASGKTPESGTKPDPEQKAVKAFSKQFANSINPTVYSRIGGFILKAASDGHNVTSAYNKNGKWVYTIKHYPSESLPKDIIDIVQNGYNSYGYFITTVDKIDQQGGKSVHIVHLQNSTSFKTLRVVNDEVEIIEDLQKA